MDKLVFYVIEWITFLVVMVIWHCRKLVVMMFKAGMWLSNCASVTIFMLPCEKWKWKVIIKWQNWELNYLKSVVQCLFGNMLEFLAKWRELEEVKWNFVTSMLYGISFTGGPVSIVNEKRKSGWWWPHHVQFRTGSAIFRVLSVTGLRVIGEGHYKVNCLGPYWDL